MGKGPSEMNTTAESLFAKLKSRSPSSAKDENSKTRSEKDKKMPPSAVIRPLDMKSVKVLVERTKFNEMHIFDSIRKNPLKLVNGGLDKARRRPLKKKTDRQSKATSAGTPQTGADGLFRIRKCYVRIPKDKVLLRLQAKQAAAALSADKRTRGRSKKRTHKRLDASAFVVATIVVDDSKGADTDAAPSSSLKRKNTEAAEILPPKRSRKVKPPKGTEFFINIGALTRTPSPRRRVTQSSSPEEVKRRGVTKKSPKKGSTQLSPTALRNKFGGRFFRSYVKVKRILDPFRAAEDPYSFERKKKKKNSKNLSVSFLETVEIFGESSDGEDWMDFDDGSFAAKSSRLKRLDNSGTLDDEPVKTFSTSTPCESGARQTPETSSSVRKTGGILKRKEKISFSPLKEDEPSPRKEQLKLANEKIVRLSFEQPPAEEDDRDTVPRTQQPMLNKETPAVTANTDAMDGGNKKDVEDKRHKSNELMKPTTPIEPETELMTPPPSAQKDESADHENAVVTNEEEEKRSLENAKDLEDEDTETPVIELKNEPPGATLKKDKENEESFESAIETSLENIADQEQPPKADVENTKQQDDLSEKLIFSETEAKDDIEGDDQTLQKDDKSIESEPIEQEQPTLKDEEEEEEISETNQVNISNSSDQHFVDASELVATALLDEERNEADAVLNDVCQMAAAESAALLSEDDNGDLDGEVVDYNSRSNDVEDDDFTSVLTHPEMERSLQSAASTLVPNSQEIVVAAAAAAAASSQCAVVSAADIDVTEDTFASVVAEVERFTKDVNSEIYPDDVGITGDDVMMDNVQASNSLDDIFDDDDVDDDIISSLRMSSGSIDIGHDKSLPIQVIETEVMAIPNEPDLIFDKPLGTTASILGTTVATTNDTLAGHGQCSTTDTNSKISLGRIFQSVKSYMMSPGGDKNAALPD